MIFNSQNSAQTGHFSQGAESTPLNPLAGLGRAPAGQGRDTGGRRESKVGKGKRGNRNEGKGEEKDGRRRGKIS